MLWLNDNPLREVPEELSKCHKLRELDLKNTFVITLPREMANLTNLLILNMEGCPLKDSLNQSYGMGMTGMASDKSGYGQSMMNIHTSLRRKEDRKMYKEQLFDHLTEWVYPSQPKE
jgi:Leucine-rich repeat (LRR) protein